MLGLLSCVSIAGCLILLYLPIPFYIALAMVVLIIISTVYFILRDALLMLPWSWQTIEVDGKGQLTITNQRGQQFKPALAANSFIHAHAIILNFKRNGFRLAMPPMILFRSVENENELRRLRVWLRWFKHEDVPHQGDSSDAAELET